MGNCARKIRRTTIRLLLKARTPKLPHTCIRVLNTREVTLVTLGLDNAGKSTVISVIMNSEFHLNTNTCTRGFRCGQVVYK